ncbi:MAG: murein transglycosylase domain-containing protein [Sulfurimonas sp.]|nr:murein transglycosylase domain-containing protein [Sulfurimonas sp.]
MFKQVIILISLLFAAGANDFQKEQIKDFNNYKKSQENTFSDYKKAQMKIFDDYKKEINLIWEKPKLSTKKSWVSYSKNKKTRSDVDFAKEIIIIETIASSQEEAKKKLKNSTYKNSDNRY